MKIQVIARDQAYQVEAGAGTRILYAGLAAGVRLPYECGSGTCGTCKARLVTGDICDLWPDAPGRKHLRQANEFLMCQCSAQGDCTLEVANIVKKAEPGECVPAFRHGVIRNCKALTRDVTSFSVELAAACDFEAGQFMLVQVPGVPGFRGYSMVNFRRAARQLDFVVKNKPGGGVSARLFSGGMDGQQVELFGPLGAATFAPDLRKNILCIAGGSGIAGMMSILSRAGQERYFENFSGHVFFGVRTARDAFYLDELSQLVRNCPGTLEVTVALSDDDVPALLRDAHPALQFDKGLVHEVAASRMQGKYQNVRAYLAGPPPAVDAAIRVLLLQARLNADNIRYDKFS